MAYRWEHANGGEIPADAYVKGHGFGDNEDRVCGPLWVARTLPDAGGAVRLGYVERGHPAVFGRKDRVEEYEVLLDRGTWKPQEGEEETPPENRVGCGHDAAGTPLYAAVSDEEQWGYWPREYPEDGSSQWWCWFLVEPIDPEPSVYPWERIYDHHAASQPQAEESAPAEDAPSHPVVSALDLRKEVVVISNRGTDEVDLGGWKIRDDSKRRPYVFRAGTILGPGGSVRLRSGPGALQPGPGELTWTTAAVWNDSGDTAFLESPAGEVVSTSRD